MNKIQKIILSIGLLVSGFFYVWVPFKYTYKFDGYTSEGTIGYTSYIPGIGPPITKEVTEEFDKLNANNKDYDQYRLNFQIKYDRVAIVQLATLMFTFACIVLAGTFGTKTSSRKKYANSRILNDDVTGSTDLRTPVSPILGGAGTETNPFVIKSKKDYIDIEYAVVDLLMAQANMEHELENQFLLSRNERYIDKLVFRAKPMGGQTWDTQISYYFDITTGFNNRIRPRWKLW